MVELQPQIQPVVGTAFPQVVGCSLCARMTTALLWTSMRQDTGSLPGSSNCGRWRSLLGPQLIITAFSCAVLGALRADRLYFLSNAEMLITHSQTLPMVAIEQKREGVAHKFC